jgi:hypothetical protein
MLSEEVKIKVKEYKPTCHGGRGKIIPGKVDKTRI